MDFCRCSSSKKSGDGLGEQEEDESSKHDPEGKKEHPLEDYEVYEIFKKKIEDACKSAPDIEPSVGMICGCLFNSSWYRAKILSLEPEVKVHYIEYGCTTWYHAGVFKELPDEIASEPPNKYMIDMLTVKWRKEEKESEVPKEKEKVIVIKPSGDSYFSTDFLVPEMPLMPFYNSYEDRLKTFETVKNHYHYREELVILFAKDGYCYAARDTFIGQDVGSMLLCHFCGNQTIISNEVEAFFNHFEGCKFAKEKGDNVLVQTVEFRFKRKKLYCQACKTNEFEVHIYPCFHGTCIKCAKKLGNQCPACEKPYAGLELQKVRGLIP